MAIKENIQRVHLVVP